MKTPTPTRLLAASALLCLIAPAQPAIGGHHEDEAEADAPGMTMGNGEKNWIVTEGAKRDGATFTFREVRIDGPGWLVLHPFKDGKPVGEIYVGSTYLPSGTSRDVAITVDPAPATGDHFIVMLHSDVNENEVFDFVFVDERNVLDKAVFEGSKMIAHTFVTPEAPEAGKASE